MKEIINFIKIQTAKKVVFGSLVMVIGGLLGSFTNYLYHLIVARILGPSDYGILDSLISLLYQLSIPLATISLVITKYVSLFKGQNRQKTIQSFFWKLNKKLLHLSPLFLVIILILTPLITQFLHLSSPLLFLWVGLSFLIGMFSVIGKSFMQGLSRFASLSFSGVLDGLSRLGITIVLLLAGWGLFGVVFPFFLASFISVFITLFFIRDLIKGEKEESIPEKKEILKFMLPVFIMNLSTTSLITSDVILVRHFLSPVDAGLYSALSTLGKIIYFATLPAVSVIFPIISETQAASQSIRKVAAPGLIIIATIILGALFIFGLFPKTMVHLLFGERYFAMIPYVFSFAIAMSLYTINFTLLNIYLAMKAFLPVFFIGLAAVLQIILIFIFHQSITQVINIFIILSSLLLSILLVYYVYVRQKITISHRPGI